MDMSKKEFAEKTLKVYLLKVEAVEVARLNLRENQNRKNLETYEAAKDELAIFDFFINLLKE